MIVLNKYPNANGICYEFEDANDVVYKLILSPKISGIKVEIYHPAKLQPRITYYMDLTHFGSQSEYFNQIAQSIRNDRS